MRQRKKNGLCLAYAVVQDLCCKFECTFALYASFIDVDTSIALIACEAVQFSKLSEHVYLAHTGPDIDDL